MAKKLEVVSNRSESIYFPPETRKQINEIATILQNDNRSELVQDAINDYYAKVLRRNKGDK